MEKQFSVSVRRFLAPEVESIGKIEKRGPYATSR